MKPYLIRVGSKAMTGGLIRRGKFTYRHKRRMPCDEEGGDRSAVLNLPVVLIQMHKYIFSSWLFITKTACMWAPSGHLHFIGFNFQ